MRQTALLSAGILFVVTLLLSSGAEAKKWADVQPGDAIEILIPAGAQQPDGTSGEDKLVITGGKILNIDTTGCGAGVHPVQHYALIDPTGNRTPKEGGLIVLLADPIRPGTRLTDPIFDFDCTIGGEPYKRYTGIVE